MLEDRPETEARARLEWADAKSCLRMAQREADAEWPQRWLIGDFRRAASTHLENWMMLRAVIRARGRRDARAFQQAAE